MRLIDADSIHYTRVLSQQGLNMELAAKVVIDDMPTIDAAPVVHGRWIQNKTVPSYHFCSNCKRAHDMPKSCNVYVLPFYCPDCGAKMDKEE